MQDQKDKERVGGKREIQKEVFQYQDTNRSFAVGRPQREPQAKEEDNSKEIERSHDKVARIGRPNMEDGHRTLESCHVHRMARIHYRPETRQNRYRREQ
jgi:hypothetical protein